MPSAARGSTCPRRRRGRRDRRWCSGTGSARSRRCASTPTPSASPVDPDRVAVFGSSFGGGHAILTAADDPRIAAAVAQCPFTDGLASALTLGPVSTAKVMARTTRDLLACLRRREPVLIALSGPPGSAALMPTADAAVEFPALVPDGQEFVNGVAARAPRAEVRRYPFGHFEIYSGEPFERAVGDQLEFLQRHLGG